ncbi:tetratricopeptide repeat protein [Candidatus Woesearchaeota archaeon]|nr:tetratricopeptide repeat protein [Candidatus Woesearchaeota archaeon]
MKLISLINYLIELLAFKKKYVCARAKNSFRSPKKNINMLKKEYNAAYKISDYNQCLAILNKMIDLDPSYYYSTYLKGCILYSQEKYSEAINFFNRAIFLNSGFSESYYKKALCYTSLGSKNDYVKSLESIDKALFFSKDNPNIYFHKGLILFNLKEYKESIKCFEQVLKLKPDFDMALYNIGAAHCNLEEFYSALKFLDNFIEKAPNNKFAHNTRANIHYKQSRYLSALKDYIIIIKQNPKDKNTFHCIKNCLEQLNWREDFYIIKLMISKTISFDEGISALEQLVEQNTQKISEKDITDIQNWANKF